MNQNSWHKSRNLHEEIFSIISTFVENKIIDERESFFVAELHDLYQSNLKERIGEEVFTYCVDKVLIKKFSDHFKDRVKITPSGTKRGHIVHNISVLVTEALDNIQNDKRQAETKVREAAFLLRESIRKSRKRQLPEDLKVEDILKGKIDTPD